ncbi:MAG: glycosyltransferase family 2 protein [Acidobacteria bacterium]|nr:glycosyltransferase family 2 protein [Acidobacteriota bacterium]
MRGMMLLPALNEERQIAAVLRGLAQWANGFEPVVIDDGSVDDTGKVARQAGATVLRHPFNLGYGAALQTGYKYALGRGMDLVVQLDADGQHDPADVARLIEPIVEGAADVVIGSRFVERSSYRMGLTRSLGRKLFGGLGKLVGLDVTDPTSGFQALNRVALELYARDFFPADYPDIDVLLMAHRRGLRVVEVPVQMREAPRKSRLHGGLRSFYYVYKIALSLWAGSGARPRRD